MTDESGFFEDYQKILLPAVPYQTLGVIYESHRKQDLALVWFMKAVQLEHFDGELWKWNAAYGKRRVTVQRQFYVSRGPYEAQNLVIGKNLELLHSPIYRLVVLSWLHKVWLSFLNLILSVLKIPVLSPGHTLKAIISIMLLKQLTPLSFVSAK